MKTPYQYLLVLLVTIFLSIPAAMIAAEDDKPQAIRFTSVPDSFNWNIDSPTPGWEDTLGWFFKRLKTEGPDFTLVA